MSRAVFGPLGMTHTAPDRTDSMIPHRIVVHFAEDCGATGYGIWWFVTTDALGHQWVFHGGSSIGGTAVFGLDRGSGVVIAILSNLSDAPLEPGRAVHPLFDR